MARYASVADMESIGLPVAATVGVDPAIIEKHLDAAGGKIESYLRSRHVLPLASPYPQELVDANARIAAYTFLVWRGFNPDSYDQNFRDMYLDLVGRPGQSGWLDKLAAGKVHLDVAADATPGTREGRARVVSRESRGWDGDDCERD